MRRSEFKTENQEEINSFLESMSFGFLATHSSDEYPNILPINFVWSKNVIYFHGARTGSKITELRKNSRVTFTVADEFSVIPSYFTDPKFACPATSFFKSVIIYGQLEFVEELEEKVFALTEFMKKLQPEGGYSPFDLEDAEYKKQIKGVNILKLIPEKISAKFKFGQNRDLDTWGKTIKGLEERNSPRDKEIIENMKKTCPF